MQIHLENNSAAKIKAETMKSSLKIPAFKVEQKVVSRLHFTPSTDTLYAFFEGIEKKILTWCPHILRWYVENQQTLF